MRFRKIIGGAAREGREERQGVLWCSAALPPSLMVTASGHGKYIAYQPTTVPVSPASSLSVSVSPPPVPATPSSLSDLLPVYVYLYGLVIAYVYLLADLLPLPLRGCV